MPLLRMLIALSTCGSFCALLALKLLDLAALALDLTLLVLDLALLLPRGHFLVLQRVTDHVARSRA